MGGVSVAVAQAMRYAGCPNRRSLGVREVPHHCASSSPLRPANAGVGAAAAAAPACASAENLLAAVRQDGDLAGIQPRKLHK